MTRAWAHPGKINQEKTCDPGIEETQQRRKPKRTYWVALQGGPGMEVRNRATRPAWSLRRLWGKFWETNTNGNQTSLSVFRKALDT